MLSCFCSDDDDHSSEGSLDDILHPDDDIDNGDGDDISNGSMTSVEILPPSAMSVRCIIGKTNSYTICANCTFLVFCYNIINAILLIMGPCLFLKCLGF